MCIYIRMCVPVPVVIVTEGESVEQSDVQEVPITVCTSTVEHGRPYEGLFERTSTKYQMIKLYSSSNVFIFLI